ncbi:MAG: hypothetical protein HQL52_07590 [Magnetococcales bacterium]|nr:hypothetical protein [Magnetococcales bacterium]
MGSGKSVTAESLTAYVRKVPDDLWNAFQDMVEEEGQQREANLRNKAKEAIKEAAAKFGFKAEELIDSKTLAPVSEDDKIPASALNLLKELSPAGLFNADASEDHQWFHKPKGAKRWTRVRPWLREELLRIKSEKGRFTTEALSELKDKYPPK